jgi:hypothetical protein
VATVHVLNEVDPACILCVAGIRRIRQIDELDVDCVEPVILQMRYIACQDRCPRKAIVVAQSGFQGG